MTPDDAELMHWHEHAGDRAPPWQFGPGARRRITRLMARIKRHQRERDAAMVGCLTLGGEEGDA